MRGLPLTASPATSVDSDPARRTTAAPVVLIVDGDHDTRELYTAALSIFGCVVVTAPDAGGAVACARDHHPDVIVTDLVMPQSDGWTLIRTLKDAPGTSTIPIVVLTGHGGPALPARARSAGCASFLMKPCLPEQLFAELKRVLALRSSGAGAPL
jgi:two-component system cell cycle response regulator DivK